MKHLTAIFLILFLSACSTSDMDGDEYSDSMGGAYGQGMSDEDLALAQQKRFGDGNIPMAGENGLFEDIHFDYDSFTISEQDRERLKSDSKVLIEDPSLRVEVEGHCDKRGTSEYNMALGESRARAVASLLISYGVSDRQVKTISYGEEIPLDPADTDEAYSRNRRVHFAIYRGDK